MTKKLFAFICLLSLAFISTQAQTDEFHRVRLGIKVAPSIIWLKPNSNGIKGDDVKLGFSYGLIFDLNFTKNYALGMGLEVAYRGGRMKVNSTANSQEVPVTYNFQYLQLPVTLKLKTNEIGYFTYFGQVGIETGFNMQGRGTDVNTYPLTSNKENIRSQLNAFNLALLIQAGAEFSLGGNASLMVSAYFSNGFVNLFRQSKINNSSAYSKYDVRSNGLGLNIGFLF